MKVESRKKREGRSGEKKKIRREDINRIRKV